jgi:hypothetical protein
LLDLQHASETVFGYTIRAWSGIATDEGVGLIVLVEVSNSRGLPVCRFEEFLADSVRLRDRRWPPGQQKALVMLQQQAIERACDAVLAGTLPAINGHRYDVKG